jgi:uncharacterized membrane protein
MLEILQGIALVAATMTTGLMAGVFGLYPLFMLWFFGALGFSAAAAALVAGEGSVLPWVVAALVLYLAVVAITIAVHLPLNDAIKAAGEPDRMVDLTAVRERFDEGRWVAWNVVRTVLSTAALGCLAWALAQFGRTVLG